MKLEDYLRTNFDGCPPHISREGKALALGAAVLRWFELNDQEEDEAAAWLRADKTS